MKNKLGNAKACKTFIKHGLVMVNNEVMKDYKYLVNQDDVIIYNGRQINAQPFVYYMLNKPEGYICANKDVKEKCVVDLIDCPECFCLGRLDRDTTGLLLLTNDASLSKRLLLPQNHVQKKYLVKTREGLKEELVKIFKLGVVIDREIKCLPSDLEIIDENHCFITINEGKYHQIKKMFLSCDNEVIMLKRVEFSGIKLDEGLLPGQYRSLTNSEINLLLKQ